MYVCLRYINPSPSSRPAARVHVLGWRWLATARSRSPCLGSGPGLSPTVWVRQRRQRRWSLSTSRPTTSWTTSFPTSVWHALVLWYCGLLRVVGCLCDLLSFPHLVCFFRCYFYRPRSALFLLCCGVLCVRVACDKLSPLLLITVNVCLFTTSYSSSKRPFNLEDTIFSSQFHVLSFNYLCIGLMKAIEKTLLRASISKKNYND